MEGLVIILVVLGALIWGKYSKKTSEEQKESASAALKVLFCIFSIVPIVCTKIFYFITKLLHIQSFSYYLLGIFFLPCIFLLNLLDIIHIYIKPAYLIPIYIYIYMYNSYSLLKKRKIYRYS